MAVVNRELGARGYAEKLRAIGCELVTVVIKSKSRGRPGKMLVLDVVASQIYVAQTKTTAGVGFAAFLIHHMQASVKALSKMQLRLDELEAKIEKKARRHKFVAGKAEIKDIFGQVVEVEIEKAMMISDMTPEERRIYRIQHLAKIGKGVNGRIEKESTLADIKPRLVLPPKSGK